MAIGTTTAGCNLSLFFNLLYYIRLYCNAFVDIIISNRNIAQQRRNILITLVCLYLFFYIIKDRFIFFIKTCIKSIGLSISDIYFFVIDSSCF